MINTLNTFMLLTLEATIQETNKTLVEQFIEFKHPNPVYVSVLRNYAKEIKK